MEITSYENVMDTYMYIGGRERKRKREGERERALHIKDPFHRITPIK